MKYDVRLNVKEKMKKDNNEYEICNIDIPGFAHIRRMSVNKINGVNKGFDYSILTTLWVSEDDEFNYSITPHNKDGSSSVSEVKNIKEFQESDYKLCDEIINGFNALIASGAFSDEAKKVYEYIAKFCIIDKKYNI